MDPQAQADRTSSSDSGLAPESRRFYNDFVDQFHRENLANENRGVEFQKSAILARNDANSMFLRIGVPIDDPGAEGINPSQYPILMQVRKFPAAVGFDANVSNPKGYEFVEIQNEMFTLEGKMKLPEEELGPVGGGGGAEIGPGTGTDSFNGNNNRSNNEIHFNG